VLKHGNAVGLISNINIPYELIITDKTYELHLYDLFEYFMLFRAFSNSLRYFHGLSQNLK
jgi:hypothetical protein